MDKICRRHIVFEGWVQGVGFRYRAKHAAELMHCTGWVKNEYDGSVIMEIQGKPDDIKEVLLGSQRGRYIRIEKMNVTAIPVVQGERGFQTRYY